MNRKERRAAGKGAATQPSPQFALAVSHHQSGALREAEQLYNAILAADPKHIDALHLLGVLANQTGQHARAVDLIGRSIALNDRNPQSHYNIGLAYAALKQWDAVETHNRRALALDPNNFEAYQNLGNALRAKGKPDEAIAAYKNALQRQPNRPDIHGNLAYTLAENGKQDEAIVHYERALSLSPNHSQGHNNLGVLLLATGRVADAVTHHQRAVALNSAVADYHSNLGNALFKHSKIADALAAYQRALELDPSSAQTHNNLGAMLILQGKYDAALPHLEKAIRAKPDFVAAHRSVVRSIVFCADNPNVLAPFGDILARAIVNQWDGGVPLVAAAVKVLENTPDIAALLDQAKRAWPARLRPFSNEVFTALANNRLLVAALAVSALRSSAGFEHLLTGLRGQMLGKAFAGNPGHEELALHAALASQCFMNEYVFDVSAAERQQLADLENEVVAALAAGSMPSPLKLVAIAAFKPLGDLKHADKLLAQTWPAPVEALLTQQMREPLEEARLRTSMPRLTTIDDAISTAVREQYEQNPYPRWSVADTNASSAQSFDQFLRDEFPETPFQALGKTDNIDYLIAGCGTGLHVLQAGRTYPGLNITAIDLSLASLSYAKRSVAANGMTNVNFGQADILRLGELGKTFDVVDSAGVLHHMADPEAGWRVLASLVRPGGFMRIGLYSTLARAGVAAARKFISARGLDQTADAIRQIRQEIFAMDDQNPVKSVSRLGDFYSLSDCRDLIFHVQEDTFDLPRIGRFLRENNLAFVGFDIPAEHRRKFDAMFPDPVARENLENWHEFEVRHPDTFIQMYQFWLRKPVAN